MAILKAQNELMELAMETAKSKGVSQSVLDQIMVAKQDNLDVAHIVGGTQSHNAAHGCQKNKNSFHYCE